ncbi:MAG: bifunctional folylpolyglutamate synthase/dihydrofolate synthase [Bacteroidetes bacterium]|nr:bifunctional folylpolyglutamate synthase/dihydrofolate synthase [Bacteroidota bacterium]
MELKQALDKLFSLHQFGIKLGLDNIKKLLEQIGNPERNLKAIHIAGSNGKGSTASFTASILQEAGYKVGLYTSPHLVRFNERIRINGVMIPDSYVRDFMTELKNYIDEYSPTFFELTTAMAYKYFKESGIDYAVIETGLGGRLDATNTIDPLASVITTISKEHTNILTDDIRTIAYEKGEIIKENRKSFIGVLPEEAETVIVDKAGRSESQLFKLSEFLEKNIDFVKLSVEEFDYKIYHTPLPGFHQFNNAALAVLVLNKVFGLKDISVINKGIDKVIINSGIQGRFETYNEEPRIIFDAAHNEEGIESFVSEFAKIKNQFARKTIIFGAMKDKNLESMMIKIAGEFDEIFVTEIDYERAATINELKIIANKINIQIKETSAPVDMIQSFKKGENNHCLVILGSIYLLGKIKEDLEILF